VLRPFPLAVIFGLVLLSGMSSEYRVTLAQERTPPGGDWERTVGRVTAANIRERVGGGVPPYISYSVELEYRFSVDNEAFLGKDTALSRGFASTRKADKVRKNYPPGASIVVFYNRDMPLISSLDATAEERGEKSALVMLATLAVVIVVLVAVVVREVLKKAFRLWRLTANGVMQIGRNYKEGERQPGTDHD
jgi:hypothetical protein